MPVSSKIHLSGGSTGCGPMQGCASFPSEAKQCLAALALPLFYS